MDEKSEKALSFVEQLIEKTKQDKLLWSRGFEDGQYKTLLPGGKLAFVIQVKGELRKFQMLDDNQEVILEKTTTRAEVNLDHIHSADDRLRTFYDAILELQELARKPALQVNEKLANAEKLLAAI